MTYMIDEWDAEQGKQITRTATPEEVADIEARKAAAAANQARNSILSQIAELESQVTPRRQREAILNIDSGWLSSIDSQIAALRAQL